MVACHTGPQGKISDPRSQISAFNQDRAVARTNSAFNQDRGCCGCRAGIWDLGSGIVQWPLPSPDGLLCLLMQYQALYRKYRPQRFDEVVGQDHVTTTLAREVVDGKVAHAYLLAGPRGTGKTTTARLLAKSLNCANRADDGEPDNTCGSCVAITEGTSLDVIELDAASNNKVEDVRDIRINASTMTAIAGSRRVYILDEAHMLTRAAGNALLKVLEEPPEHVIFVLATTEPYKLLDTIRSRSQRFDFHPVATETLISYLGKIADAESFKADRAALEAVTAHSGGSVRDAMSLLEQVAALGAGTVSAEGVSKALGLADHQVYARFVKILADGDAAAGLGLIAELAGRGTDLRRFVSDAIGHFRGIFLAQYASNIGEVVDASSETIAEWTAQAKLLPASGVLRAIDELSNALLQLREGREERLVVEITVIRLTRPEAVPSLEGVNSRIDRIERDLAELKRTGVTIHSAPAEDTGPADRPFVSTAAEIPDPRSQIPDPAQKSEGEPAEAESGKGKAESVRRAESGERKAESAPPEAELTIAAFQKAWPAVMADIRNTIGPRRQALLREASPTAIDQSSVIFEVASHMHFHLEQLKNDTEITEAIVTACQAHLGVAISVVFRSADAPPVVSTEDTETAPDKDDLRSADDDEAIDPVNVVVNMFDGQIVDE
jgi:DNA polymerase III subunit gamma/tau